MTTHYHQPSNLYHHAKLQTTTTHLHHPISFSCNAKLQPTTKRNNSTWKPNVSQSARGNKQTISYEVVWRSERLFVKCYSCCFFLFCGGVGAKLFKSFPPYCLLNMLNVTILLYKNRCLTTMSLSTIVLNFSFVFQMEVLNTLFLKCFLIF